MISVSAKMASPLSNLIYDKKKSYTIMQINNTTIFFHYSVSEHDTDKTHQAKYGKSIKKFKIFKCSVKIDKMNVIDNFHCLDFLKRLFFPILLIFLLMKVNKNKCLT